MNRKSYKYRNGPGVGLLVEVGVLYTDRTKRHDVIERVKRFESRCGSKLCENLANIGFAITTQ